MGYQTGVLPWMSDILEYVQPLPHMHLYTRTRLSNVREMSWRCLSYPWDSPSVNLRPGSRQHPDGCLQTTDFLPSRKVLMESTNGERVRLNIYFASGQKEEGAGCHFGRRQDPFKPDWGVCPCVSGGVCQPGMAGLATTTTTASGSYSS